MMKFSTKKKLLGLRKMAAITLGLISTLGSAYLVSSQTMYEEIIETRIERTYNRSLSIKENIVEK